MNRTVTLPRSGSALRAQAKAMHTYAQGVWRKFLPGKHRHCSCSLQDDSLGCDVHCGTDKHQPACHPEMRHTLGVGWHEQCASTRHRCGSHHRRPTGVRAGYVSVSRRRSRKQPRVRRRGQWRARRRCKNTPPRAPCRKFSSLGWRAPYVDSRNTLAEPVREISFTFYNDALYQVIVNYGRDRTEGLTNRDIVESLSTAYGAARLASAKTRTSPPADAFPPIASCSHGGRMPSRW
jgi:hypothetical protein